VTKHSLATHGSVRVWREEAQLWFEVRDNGRGFDSEAAAERGGLQNLRDRLDVLGGRLDVTSTAGGGTCVIGCVPLPTQGSRLGEGFGGGRRDRRSGHSGRGLARGPPSPGAGAGERARRGRSRTRDLA
jgi:hypothetical protein